MLYHSHNKRTALYPTSRRKVGFDDIFKEQLLPDPFRGFSLSSLNRSSAHALFLQIAAAEHQSRSMEICSALRGVTNK